MVQFTVSLNYLSKSVVLKLFWLAAQKITKIWPRHNTIRNLIFVRIKQGCGSHKNYRFCLEVNFIVRFMIAVYYGRLVSSLRVQKTEKSDISFVELKCFWHIFNFLTPQYCASAHSLRITVLSCKFPNNKIGYHGGFLRFKVHTLTKIFFTKIFLL